MDKLNCLQQGLRFHHSVKQALCFTEEHQSSFTLNSYRCPEEQVAFLPGTLESQQAIE